MKACSKCGLEKPKTEFYKDKGGRDGLRRQCKECVLFLTRESRKLYRLLHPEKAAEATKRWRLKHPERADAASKRYAEKYPERLKESRRKSRERHPETSKRHRLKVYGITLLQFNQMLEDQKGRCLICKDVMKPACVDHCHVSGKVRGLLCDYCNVGLGRFKDSPERLLAAVNYLQK